MAIVDKEYHKLVNTILKVGYWYDDPYRKGVRRKEISNYEFKYDLTQGFPAMTTKDLFWKGVVAEAIWFLRGESNIKSLVDNGVNIWNKDAWKFAQKHGYPGDLKKFIFEVKQGNRTHNGFPLGELGRVYGKQWRSFCGAGEDEYNTTYTDQIANLVKGMQERPLATDLIVEAWNPSELTNMALPPCHYGFQILGRPLTINERLLDMHLNYANVDEVNNELNENREIYKQEKILDKYNIPKYGFSLIWNQRSVDTFLGLPFNIASYALIANILGDLTNMVPLELIGSLRKVHIYDNAIDTINSQLRRDVHRFKDCKLTKTLPFLNDCLKYRRSNIDLIFNRMQIKDFTLKGYKSYSPLKVEMLARDE